MNTLNKSIDYGTLQRDLHNSLCEDELYKLQNSAKFRAVEQNVPTYEHFRQMVNAAHLKPLDNVDLKKLTKVSWNNSFIMNNNGKELETNCDTNSDILLKSNVNVSSIPKTNNEFYQIWNELKNPDEKLNFLYEIRGILKFEIFATEITASFLNECIEIFHLLIETNTKIILELLQIFSECNRFQLNLNFLSKKDTELCAIIFTKLLQITENEDKNNIIMLSQKYEINL